MDAVGWVVGFLLAVGGYVLRLGQDWLTYWRQGVVEDRDRWKSARMSLLVEIGDVATDVIALARAQRDKGHTAWADPEFAATVASQLGQWQRLHQRALLLVAHRETLQDLQTLHGHLIECLPPHSATDNWNADATAQAATSMLWGMTHTARFNELRLQPIGLTLPVSKPRWMPNWVVPLWTGLDERLRG